MGITGVPFGRTELSLRLSWIEFVLLNPGTVPRDPGFKECPKSRVFMIFRGVISQKKNLRNFWDLFLSWPSEHHFWMILRGPNIHKKNLRNFWNLWPWPSENDFWMILRGPMSTEKNLRNFSDLFWTCGPEIIDFWPPRGSRTTGPSRILIYFLCCGPWILTSCPTTGFGEGQLVTMPGTRFIGSRVCQCRSATQSKVWLLY